MAIRIESTMVLTFRQIALKAMLSRARPSSDDVAATFHHAGAALIEEYYLSRRLPRS